jgi:hypothetical protein
MIDVVEHHLAGDCGIQQSAVVHDAGWSSVAENVEDSAEVLVQLVRPTTHDGGTHVHLVKAFGHHVLAAVQTGQNVKTFLFYEKRQRVCVLVKKGKI